MRGLTDSAGTLTDAYRYDAYGNWLDKTGSTRNAYGYRGEQYDAALEAYYLRARYYQPGSGRFVSTEPVEGLMGDPLSHHRYMYGYDNPINNLDPSGRTNLQEVTITTGIVSALTSFGLGVTSLVNQDFGENLAQLLPDAGVIGVSGTITGRATATLLGILGKNAPLPGFDIESGLTVGLEAVFSIASAQYGLYVYGGSTINASLTDYKPLNLGFTFYHGWV